LVYREDYRQQAVERFVERHWDVILMDIQMPVMGGIEATRLIRAQESLGHRVPIIAITANAMAADRDACISAGMDDHLCKPYSAAGLSQIIERMTRR
jgi:CheY-like chemotaxis protein